MLRMKIFYVCNIDESRYSNTGAQRMRGLQHAGHEIIAFDLAPHQHSGGRVQQSITYHFCVGPTMWRLNGDLVRRAAGISCDLVWIDKGVWIYPSTLSQLREITGSPIVHYTADPAITFHRTRHFIRSIPKYDVCVTTKSYELDEYRRLGSQHVIFENQQYDPEIFCPMDVSGDDRKRLASDVCFIGHGEDHYAECVEAAAEVTDRIAVWGAWEPYIAKRPKLRQFWRGRGIYNREYAAALCSAKVALGLLSKWVAEKTTTRTFEIPACGTFMLAERTDEHLALFKEGVEAEFFSSKDELREKLRFYLAHDNIRQKIAASGRRRCEQSGYDVFTRMRSLTEVIEGIVTSTRNAGGPKFGLSATDPDGATPTLNLRRSP